MTGIWWIWTRCGKRHLTALGMVNGTDKMMSAAVIDNDKRTTPGKIAYVIVGLVYAFAAYQVPALIVDFVISSSGATDLVRSAILIQAVVGISLCMFAYSRVTNPLLKLGMRICYGVVLGTLFAIGTFTILTSF